MFPTDTSGRPSPLAPLAAVAAAGAVCTAGILCLLAYGALLTGLALLAGIALIVAGVQMLHAAADRRDAAAHHVSHPAGPSRAVRMAHNAAHRAGQVVRVPPTYRLGPAGVARIQALRELAAHRTEAIRLRRLTDFLAVL